MAESTPSPRGLQFLKESCPQCGVSSWYWTNGKCDIRSYRYSRMVVFDAIGKNLGDISIVITIPKNNF